MNYNECLSTTKQYLLARIPFISFNTVERARTLDLISTVSKEIQLPISVHTMSKGMYDLTTGQILNEDKTIMGALDFISEQIKIKENLTFVLTEVSDIDTDTMVARYFMDVVTLAEEKGATIIVITNNSVWSQLQRLGMNITLELPTEEEILQIIKENVEPYKNQIQVEWDENNYKEAATILAGISKVEIKNVIASLIAKGVITKNDLVELKFAKDKLFSNINGLEKINIDGLNLTFGGLKGLKAWLEDKKKLLSPDKKEEMKARGMKPPRGILLVGVPGCGKSLSAKAIAATWQLPLYRLDFATVQGKYVGQSEQQLKEAFSTAEHVSPCVLWIDEIEKGLGGSSDSGVTTKMIGQFLFWLQECRKEVFVVATANDVTKLPAELLRRGRFDEMFFVDLPDALERHEVITMYIERYLRVRLPEQLTNMLVQITDGFTGADIESSIRDIAYKLVANPTLQINDQLLINSLKAVVPLSKTNPEKIKFIRDWGKDRATSASGNPIGGSSSNNNPEIIG